MKAVLLTTKHRGVFFGYLDGEPSQAQVKLTRARNCIYWHASVKGFEGLAVTGPNDQCKVGPAAKSLLLYNITSVVECDPEAVDAWEKAPWGA